MSVMIPSAPIKKPARIVPFWREEKSVWPINLKEALYLKVFRLIHLVQLGSICIRSAPDRAIQANFSLSEHRLTKATQTPVLAASAANEVDATLPQDFETALAELEALVATMESGSLALEQSLTAYTRGVALTRLCQQKLAQAEQQVKVLEAGMLRPFDGQLPDGL